MIRFTLYVPAEMPDGTTVPNRWLKDLERTLAVEFGGFTRTTAYGGWKSPDETVISEPMFLYAIDVSPSVEDFARAKLRQHAAAVKVALKQESVYTTEESLGVFIV